MKKFISGLIVTALSFTASIQLANPGALLFGRTPSYPDAVISAGAQVAWDLQNWGGYRPANLTKTIAVNGLPPKWTLTGGKIQTTAIGAELVGYDLTGTGYAINIVHGGAVVRDNKVDLTTAATNSFNAAINISTSQFFSGTLVEYNEVDCGSSPASPSPRVTQAGIYDHQSGNATNTTIRGNYVHNCGGDVIDIAGGGSLIELNNLKIGGWSNATGAHMDQIQLVQPRAGGSLIQDNFMDITPDPNYTWGRTSSIALNTPYGDVLIQRNIIGYGARVPDNTGIGRATVLYSGVSGNIGISIINNVFDYRNAGNGPTPGPPQYGFDVWADNYYLPDNSLISKPN